MSNVVFSSFGDRGRRIATPSGYCGDSSNRPNRVRPISLSRHRSRVFGQVSTQRDHLLTLVDALTEERDASLALSIAHEALAVADERDRIARDLHDTVIQRLFATGIALQGAIGRGSAVADTAMDRTVEEIDAAIREIRTSIFHLRRPNRPAAVSDTIAVMLEEFRRMLSGTFSVQVVQGLDLLVSRGSGDELVALLRETLMNVVKHASAATVSVMIGVEDNGLHIRVVDDGVGFSERSVTGGHGLRNLHARASAVGGSFAVRTSPGIGTEATFRLPLEALSL